MSYTRIIKDKMLLCETKSQRENIAEIYGIYLMCSGFLRTHDGELARRAFRQLQRSGGIAESVSFRSGANPLYMVKMRLTLDFKMDNEKKAGAFIRGCFLLGGFINEPSKPSHLEIAFKEEYAYELCMAAFETCGIFVKGTIRNGKFLLYLKDSDQITAFLTKCSLVREALEFENEICIKQCKINSNRVTNCDGANIDKTVKASARQVKMLRSIKESSLYCDLSDNLREALNIRLEHPEMPLSELSSQFDPVISRSGLHHRLKKLEEIYKDNLAD